VFIVPIKRYIKYINYLYVWPFLTICYFLFIIGNIDGLFGQLYPIFCLQKFEQDNYVFNFIFIHFTILIFAIYTKILNIYLKGEKYKTSLESIKNRRFDNINTKCLKLNESLVKYN